MVDPLVITEKWITERLNLTIDTLEDVRSLALPGSYHEKVTHLGRSLAGFTRLKHLDLSRNAICSLQGLEHLHLLETLNLYYNNVPDLQELYRLRHNANLKELDLRLNPVTKNEPDYRLFVIHMLVKIRLLDDRPVRDTERKAALMHFDSSQAVELRHQEVNSQSHSEVQDSIPKHIQSRKKLVNSLAKPPVHIGSDETDQLLDLIAENEEKLAPGRIYDGSGKKKQKAFRQQQHSTPKAVNITTKPSAKMHSKSPSKHTTPSTAHHHQRSTANQVVHTPRSTPTTNHMTPHSVTRRVGGDTLPSAVAISDEIQLRELFNILKGKDVVHWETNSALQSRLLEWLGRQSGRRERGVSHDEHVAGEVTAVVARLEQKEAELCQVSEKLKEREMEAIVLGQKLQLQAEEMDQLRLKQQQNNDPTSTELLQQAQADLSTLNEHVRNLQKENSSLRVQLSQDRDGGSPSDPQLLVRLQTENKLLRAEIDSLTQQSRQQQQGLNQVQELATMLQESHRSLVATNDHLLRELEEAKRRHKLELQQSHSNYEQLRQTVELIQET